MRGLISAILSKSCRSGANTCTILRQGGVLNVVLNAVLSIAKSSARRGVRRRRRNILVLGSGQSINQVSTDRQKPPPCDPTTERSLRQAIVRTVVRVDAGLFLLAPSTTT